VQAFAPFPGLEEAFLHLPTTPQSERLIEMECDLLWEGGLDTNDAMQATIALNAYVTGWTILASTRSERGLAKSIRVREFSLEFGLDALLVGIASATTQARLRDDERTK
jgi:hypothetical protein